MAALSSGLFAYYAFQFAFRFEEVRVEANSPRRAWFWDLVRSNDGTTGVILFTIFGLICAWATFVAGWRFFSDGTAARLTERGLVLHSSYRRGGEIPFEDVFSADVVRNPYGSWLFKTRDLKVDFRSRRRVVVRSPIIEGGKEALQAFAKELNARRAFDGGSGNKGHEGRS